MSYEGPGVLIVGWDGATFPYIDPWLKKGSMPNLSRLLERSAKGTLKSVQPPQTPVAWPCLTTGMNPGKLGIYGWWHPDPATYELVSSNASSIEAKRIWDLIGEAGMSVGVMNIPLTYPAGEVNGFCVAGFDSPLHHADLPPDIAYPAGLLDELKNAGLDYRVLIAEQTPGSSSYRDLLDAWIRMEDTRTEATISLIHRYQPDFMMIVHHITDFFHHRAPKDSILLERAYQNMDRSLGRYLERCSDETRILVVSDHGAIEMENLVFIHNWLEQEGFLRFHSIVDEERLVDILKMAAGQERLPQEWISRVLELWRQLPGSAQRSFTGQLRKQFPGCMRSHENIDWANTKLFSVSNYGQLFVNTKGRFGQGCVSPGPEYDQVIRAASDALLKLRDPQTGLQLVKEVIHRDQLYLGAKKETAPDLTPLLNDHRYYFCMPYSMHLEHNQVIAKTGDYVKDDEHSFVGDHDDNGILIAAGPGIAVQNLTVTPNIIDIAPTVLYMLGLPIPGDMDGCVIKEIFSHFSPDRAQPTGPPALQGDSIQNAPGIDPSNEQSEDAMSIREKLKLLGYRIK